MAQLGDEEPIPMVQPGTAQGFDPVGVAEEWRGWMAEPGNRQALMQFGIQMMQPVAAGQSVAGHIGQSIGGAGEAVDRFQMAERQERELTRKEVETGSKIEEREGKLQLGEQGLQIKAMREETRKAESAAKIRNLDDRAKLWAEQATYWAARAAAEPGNAEAKRRLQEAQTKLAESTTALKDEMTRVTPLETAIRQQRANTAETQGAQRIEQGQQRIDQGAARLDIMRLGQAERAAHWATMDENKKQELYEAAKLMVGEKRMPSRAQWEAENFKSAGGAKPPAATATPAGAAPKVGDRQEFKQGWGVWDGTKWVPEKKK